MTTPDDAFELSPLLADEIRSAISTGRDPYALAWYRPFDAIYGTNTNDSPPWAELFPPAPSCQVREHLTAQRHELAARVADLASRWGALATDEDRAHVDATELLAALQEQACADMGNPWQLRMWLEWADSLDDNPALEDAIAKSCEDACCTTEWMTAGRAAALHHQAIVLADQLTEAFIEGTSSPAPGPDDMEWPVCCLPPIAIPYALDQVWAVRFVHTMRLLAARLAAGHIPLSAHHGGGDGAAHAAGPHLRLRLGWRI